MMPTLSQFSLTDLAQPLTAPQQAAVLAQLDTQQTERLQSIREPARLQQALKARQQALHLLAAAGVSTQLAQTAAGRPYAPAWPALEGLSWTHCPHAAAAALGQGRVGIDLEYPRRSTRMLALAQRYFSPREAVQLAATPAAEQSAHFYLRWVAKEALLKALGTGIVGGLARFELLQTAQGWQLLTTEPGDWQVEIWQVAERGWLALASDQAQRWQALHADISLTRICSIHKALDGDHR